MVKNIIVYSYYSLDIIHTGHIQHMKRAKELAGEDGLSIVGILSDEAIMERKPNPPILSFDERMRIAEAVRYVDMVVPQMKYSPVENVRNIKPDILVESESHGDGYISIVEHAVKPFCSKVVVFPYYPLQSSTKIKAKICQQEKIRRRKA